MATGTGGSVRALVRGDAVLGRGAAWNRVGVGSVAVSCLICTNVVQGVAYTAAVGHIHIPVVLGLQEALDVV